MEQKINIELDSEFWNGTIEEIDHPVHQMFFGSFSNGYQNIFFTDPESGKWLEQDMGETDLAGKLGQKLSFGMLETDVKPLINLNWFKQSVGGKLIHFGYHIYCIEGYSAFEIFAPNHRFMYTLIKLDSNHWKVFKIIHIDWCGYQSSLDELPSILDKYVLCA